MHVQSVGHACAALRWWRWGEGFKERTVTPSREWAFILVLSEPKQGEIVGQWSKTSDCWCPCPPPICTEPVLPLLHQHKMYVCLYSTRQKKDQRKKGFPHQSFILYCLATEMPHATSLVYPTTLACYLWRWLDMSFFGPQPEDVLPAAWATRPYAPLNHVVRPPCCAPTCNRNNDGRGQMIWIHQQNEFPYC